MTKAASGRRLEISLPLAGIAGTRESPLLSPKSGTPANLRTSALRFGLGKPEQEATVFGPQFFENRSSPCKVVSVFKSTFRVWQMLFVLRNWTRLVRRRFRVYDADCVNSDFSLADFSLVSYCSESDPMALADFLAYNLCAHNIQALRSSPKRPERHSGNCDPNARILLPAQCLMNMQLLVDDRRATS